MEDKNVTLVSDQTNESNGTLAGSTMTKAGRLAMELSHEKKRLKQEQKAAKARKAFAIMDIIISTAVAVSRVLWNPFLVGLVSAMGALQLATVFAQPIPQ